MTGTDRGVGAGTMTAGPRGHQVRTLAGPFDLHCWVLLGKLNRRKGSVIRALTGLARENSCEIMLETGQSLPFWSPIAAINEVPRGQELPEPDAWAKALLMDAGPIPGDHPILPSRRNLLIALRLDLGVPNREPEDYLSALSACGATLESIVTLGEPTRPQFTHYGAPFADIPFDPDAQVVATNALAQQVRRFWGWR
jgi:hypothetical protein